MATLTKARTVLFPSGTIKKLSFPLPATFTAYDGGNACFDSANPGAVYPAVGGSNTLSPIGQFSCPTGSVVGSSTAMVGVILAREVNLVYCDNATGGGAITVSNLGTNVYLLDNTAVTTTAGSNSHSGRVWIVNAGGTGQIGVEFPF
jgi:hypothetical protein